jgi:membrane dipeptidase
MLDSARKFDAQAFCRANFLFDAHSDIFWHVDKSDYDILKRNDERHFDLPRAKEGGLDAVVAAACYDPKHTGDVDPEEYAMHLINLMNDAEKRSGGRFIKLTKKGQFDAFGPDAERLGYIVSIEGGAPFKGDMKRFERFYDAGMRLLTLTHNENNEISQGVNETEGPYYITGFGWEVIAACEEKGVVVDAAHLNENNIKYLLDLCTKPFTVSHTACRAIADHKRNILDDHLFELGRLGCVVGIDVIQPHINAGPDYMDATIDDVLDHIEHAADVAGIDAVGLGTDMDIIYPLPKGLTDATSYPDIAAGLHKRGWKQDDIAKVMGGNFCRLFSAILPAENGQL